MVLVFVFSSFALRGLRFVDTNFASNTQSWKTDKLMQQNNAPIAVPRIPKTPKALSNIAVEKEQRNGKPAGEPKEKGNRVSLSCQSRSQAIVSSLLSVVVVGIVVQRQRSTAPLTSTLIPHHGQRILISSNLSRTLRRLIHRRSLPIAIGRRRRLKLSSTVSAHILHRVALLGWVCRVVLLVVCVVVLLRVGIHSAAARDEPAVVG